MIAVDTNILVYAHRAESSRHDRACLWLRYLAEGSTPWGIPLFCLAEFVRITTHRRVFDPASTIEQAIEAIDAILESPSLHLLVPSAAHWPLLRASIVAGNTSGNLVFDAQIAAVCRENGIERLLTEDHDFSRFKFIHVVTLSNEPAA
jgi:uncharacterized protein